MREKVCGGYSGLCDDTKNIYGSGGEKPAPMALNVEVKQGKVYDKVKNKIYFITNAAATAPVRRRESVCLYRGARG